MKILIIEKSIKKGENYKHFFSEHNFIVTITKDSQQAYKELLRSHYDLLVFDLVTPFKNEVPFIKHLSDENIRTPIIILSEIKDIKTKQQAYLVGADDFIVKPFEIKELLLRIRALLKRTLHIKKINRITAGDIVLDLDLRKAIRGKQEIYLTPKEFQILEYLMLNKNRVVTKHELLQNIWGGNNDIWSDVIKTHIQLLRKKINSDCNYNPIKTVRGIGFIFEMAHEK